jgi:hypothetical protein
MSTATAALPMPSRTCGIARKLGNEVQCPPGGCALLRSLGETLPADAATRCPVDALARGDNELVLWTLDALRRELERDPHEVGALRHEHNRGSRHADIMRRWS